MFIKCIRVIWEREFASHLMFAARTNCACQECNRDPARDFVRGTRQGAAGQ
jgi:hypothetical protein